MIEIDHSVRIYEFQTEKRERGGFVPSMGVQKHPLLLPGCATELPLGFATEHHFAGRWNIFNFILTSPKILWQIDFC